MQTSLRMTKLFLAHIWVQIPNFFQQCKSNCGQNIYNATRRGQYTIAALLSQITPSNLVLFPVQTNAEVLASDYYYSTSSLDFLFVPN